MNSTQLAHFYAKKHGNFKDARLSALNNLVNRNDLYKPSNKFLAEFWAELHLIFNS